MVAAAVDNGKIETNFQGPGRYAGWHFFKDVLDWKKLARECGEKAILFLDAKECPSGRFPVVITNGWGGVIFHEACGHSLEATATAKHLSVFSDSIGKQIANPIVSAFDDGTMPNEWGSNNIDSEGHVTQKNQLIKDGICVGFLVDKFNGRRLNMGVMYVLVNVVGLSACINGAFLYIFLSADSIYPQTIFFGTSYFYEVLPLSFALGVLFIGRNVVQGLGRPLFPFLAGVGELIARLLACTFLPSLINPVNPTSNASFYGVALADPLAWSFACLFLIYGLVRYVYMDKGPDTIKAIPVRLEHHCDK